MRKAGIMLGAAPLLLAAATASAGWSSKGEVAFENRAFVDDNQTLTQDYGVGLFSRLELTHKHKPFRQRVRLYGRVDGFDDGRSTLIVEEAWLEVKDKPLNLRVGLDIVNWSATEAFHPADILNARNLDSDLESLEKIGEPMVAISHRIGTGKLTAYILPVYMDPKPPSNTSRLSFLPPGTVLGERLRMNRHGEFTDDDVGAQAALRFTQSIDNADVGLHVVHHMDRHQPEVVFDSVIGRPRVLLRTVTQVGSTYTHVSASTGLIIKFEAVYRMFANPDEPNTRFGRLRKRDHGQVAIGLEYGIPHDSGGETTLIAEGQSVVGVGKRKRADLHVFQNDVLLGFRLAFNDIDSKELLLSTIIDVERKQEILASLSYSQRISDTWSVKGAVRFIHAPVKGDEVKGLELLRDSDHVRLSIIRHF